MLVDQLNVLVPHPRWASTAPTGPTRAANGPAWFPSLENDQGPGLAVALDALALHAVGLLADHDLGPADTVVLGWSQGAAASLALALRADGTWYPRTVVALSTWLVNEADVVWDIDAAADRSTRVLLVHGVDDEVVPVSQARSVHRVLDRARIDVTLLEVDAGHDLHALLPAALTWLERDLDWHTRGPR